MEDVQFSVPGISCGHCVATIERVVGEIAGVLQVHADAATKCVTVSFAPPATREAIEKTLTDWGFPPSR